MRILAIIAVTAAAWGCTEIPQDARKPFTTAEDTKAADASLATRALVQDDYARTGDAKR